MLQMPYIYLMKKITAIAIIIYCLFLTACVNMGINGKHKVEYVLQLSPKNSSPKTQKTSIQVLSNRLTTYGLKPRQFSIIPLGNDQIRITLKKEDFPEKVKKLLLQKGCFSILEPYPTKEILTNSCLNQIDDLLQSASNSSKLSSLLLLSENSMYSTELAHASKTDTSQINTYLSLANIRALFPKDLQFMWSSFPSQLINGNQYFALYAAKTNDAASIPFDSKDIVKATAKRNDHNLHIILLNFKKTSHQKLEELTAKNVEKFILLTIDSKVYSAPKVMEKLTGGAVQISGNFTESETITIAHILQNGSLPTEVELISESLIGK